MSERQGVEIDYCPECRGIWLDRGELDKILDQARIASAPSHGAPAAPQREQPPVGRPYGDRQYGDPRYGDRRDGRYGDPKYRKKKSPLDFLGDFFE